MYVKGILSIIIAVLLHLQLVNGCSRGSIKIQNNGYKDILIAISENTPDNPTLVDRIKAVFTDASAFLYSATRKRSFFEEITILVPSSWSGAYSRAGKETFDKSDILIDVPDTRFGQGNKPFVIKTTGCGETGHYMHLTVDFIMNASVAAEYGPYHKILVHEWAHLRYGVYDEYQMEYPGAKHFYASTPDGTPEAIRCGLSIQGSKFNVVSGGSCIINSDTGVPEPECRLQETIPTGTTGYASIMYKVNLDAVTDFCDNDTNQPLTLHNAEAPNPQNQYCSQRSVWEVLREHQDFSNNNNPPREITNTTPIFRVVQQQAIRNVLVLDVSGSMRGSLLETLGQGCSNYISNIIQDDELLGVVWFNSTGMPIANLTVIDNVTRADMLKHIPTLAKGGTSVGGGIDKALLMLEQHNPNDIGGNLIVVTDGKENQRPYISEVLSRVVSSQVTVHTIAITTNADANLDLLASQTGGLSFVYSGGQNSNAINEAFLTIGDLNLKDPTDRSYVIKSESQMLAGNGVITGSTLIDNTLGRDTQLLFDYSTGDIDPVVTSPSGTIYTKTSSVVKHDTTFGIYRFTIPQAEFQSGRWQYTITSKTGSQMRVAVTIKSKSATLGQYPIVATVHWGKKTIANVAPGSNNQKQTIFASVSKGYAPVLNAVVVANVESITTSSTFQVTLLDNGAGADVRAGDGIYSAYFLQFTSAGRYGLSVQVDSNAATVVSPQRIVGYGVGTAYTAPVPDQTVDPFVRSSVAGSFTLENYTSPGPSGKFYPPGQVVDLSVLSVSYDNQTVTLTWTAVGDQLDQGQASSYELRIGTNFNEMKNNFVNQNLVTEDMVVSDNNLTSPKPAGQQETFVIQVPTKGDITYVFAVKAVDTVNRNTSGTQSNIATASLKNFNQPPPEQLIGFALLMSLIVGCVAVLAVFITVIVVICVKNKARTPHEASSSITKAEYQSNIDQGNSYTNIALDQSHVYTGLQHKTKGQKYMNNSGMHYINENQHRKQNVLNRY